MASPGITPIQLIAVTNPCLCSYLAEADGALLDRSRGWKKPAARS